MIAAGAGTATGAGATGAAAGAGAVAAEPLAWVLLEQIGTMMLSMGIVAVVPLALGAVRVPGARSWTGRVVSQAMLPLVVPFAKVAVDGALNYWRSQHTSGAHSPGVKVETLQLVHALPGRVRLRMERLKGNAALAAETAEMIASVEGVEQVTTNIHTGSILIRYDPGRLKSFSFVAFHVEHA